MKKTIGILALLVFAGNIASAELLKNFKWDGKIIVNAINANNTMDADSDAKDKFSDVDTYVELNAGFTLAEDVDAIVTAVKTNRQHGDSAETVAAGTADGFTMEQAYLNLKGILGLDHKIGRQYYGNQGDLIIYAGPKGMPYMMEMETDGIVTPGNAFTATGLDAWTGWYKNEKLNLHAIVAKITNDNNDDGAGPNFDRIADEDTDLAGIVAKYDLMEVLNLSAYVYEKKTNQAAGTANNTLDAVGVKANGKILGFDYYGELAKNYGRQAVGKNYTGTAFLAGAKYDIELVGKWTFMGEMGIGSGDDKTYAADKDINEFAAIAGDYRPGVIWGGVFGNEGLGNLTTWNLGAKWNTPMFEKLTLSGKLAYFAPTVTKVNSTAAGAAKTDIGYDTYGQELDLCANWQHNENVGLKAYYAMFNVDSDYADTALGGKDDVSTTLGAAVTVKF